MERRTTSTLWSLRPAGEHAALRRVAQGAGFRLRVLPVQRLVVHGDASGLAAALAAPIRLYTSPAAVRFAARRVGGDLRREGLDLAVGAGTAAALRRTGVAAPRSPSRMDSEGVLAMQEWDAGGTVGLVTAPGGRGLLVPALRGRGIDVRVAEVYRRAPTTGGARRFAAFAADAGAVLVASSAEAMALLQARLPAAASPRGRELRRRPVVVSSARLAAQAASAGFSLVLVAEGPTPAALVAAASRAPTVQ